MADIKKFLRFHKATLLYSLCLALLLFLLKWLELRFIIFDYSLEIYIVFIAFLFTAIGIGLALKLSKPRIEPVVVRKDMYLRRHGTFILNKSLVKQLDLNHSELAILTFMAKGTSHKEMSNLV